MSADPSVWPTAFQRLPLPRPITKLVDCAYGKSLRKEDIDAVCQYIVENRDNPQLREIQGQLLEDSAEHLKEKAKDGCVPA